MDTKPKGHGSLNDLTEEQRVKVDEWLFKENATYREVVQRCAKDFGVSLTIASVGRYYRREYGTRAVDRFARRLHERDELVKVIEAHPESGRGYRLALELMEDIAVEEALKPAKQRDGRLLAQMARVLIA